MQDDKKLEGMMIVVAAQSSFFSPSPTSIELVDALMGIGALEPDETQWHFVTLEATPRVVHALSAPVMFEEPTPLPLPKLTPLEVVKSRINRKKPWLR